MPNEQQQFLQELEEQTLPTVLEEPLIPEKEEKEEEGSDYQPRNRRERRLEQKYQAERESAIALAARLDALSEAQKARTSETDDYLKGIEKIYGSDSPEAREATEILKSTMRGLEERAIERAYERMREEQEAAENAVSQEERNLDDMIAELEDTYNVDLSPAQQRNFFQMLERLSPKDRNGNITDYADPHAVWEVMQTRKADNKAKDLSSRSMVSSGTSQPSKLQDDAHVRFLKENGII